jgi:hypothetical protein
MKRANRSLGMLWLAWALASVAASGCSGTGDGNRFGELLGRVLAPESGQPVPLANETVVLLTYDEEGNIVTAEVGTTDENGEFKVDVEAQAVVALVVSGMTDDGTAEISGLYNPEAGLVLEKVLDQATSIACVAGLTAVGDDSITQEQLDQERVDNLEDGADAYIEANPDFDFYDARQRDAAVEAVRTSTDDGANPPT